MQKICIVIPCYNEASRLQLNSFQEFIEREPLVDFLFSNDGSTDGTQTMLENFRKSFPERVTIIQAKSNAGKAEAVRMGILQAFANDQYEFAGFWDADLATPLDEISFLMAIKNKDIILGSRWKRLGATIERNGSRHILGRVFSTFASIILKLPVYDTQCGAKLFNKSVKTIFEEKFITRWLFDIEIIARYRNQKGKGQALERIMEFPLQQWFEKGGSKIKMKHMLKVPFELLKINSKYN